MHTRGRLGSVSLIGYSWTFTNVLTLSLLLKQMSQKTIYLLGIVGRLCGLKRYQQTFGILDEYESINLAAFFGETIFMCATNLYWDTLLQHLCHYFEYICNVQQLTMTCRTECTIVYIKRNHLQDIYTPPHVTQHLD